MANVPENELLSAYLDGELTAGEQAEVEKLLAASPAARQLLEELRALSTTLQNLPAHRLDEDISGPVLRQAERQMLSEPVAPTVDLLSPAPAATGWRSIVRRALTPRALVWSGTAVAVAVMLAITNSPLDEPPVERVAMAPKAVDRSVAEKSMATPSIRAAAEATDEAELREGDAVSEMEAPDAEAKLDDAVAMPTMSKAAPPPAPKTAPTRPPRAAVAKKAPSPSVVAKSGIVRKGKGGSSAFFGRAGGAAPGGQAQQLRGTQAIQGVLVVRCDISPEAARDQTFDRILASQKITLERTAAEANGRLHKQRRQSEEGKLQAKTWQSAGEIDLIHAEATPVQIEGTLAALAAQPGAFLSVSVEPDPAVPAQQSWRRYARGRSLPAKSSAMQAARQPKLDAMQQAPTAQAPADRPATQKLQMEIQADKPVQAEGQKPEKPKQTRADGQAPATQQKPESASDTKQQAEPSEEKTKGPQREQAATYRVLFVLRVVGQLPRNSLPSVEASEKVPAAKQ